MIPFLYEVEEDIKMKIFYSIIIVFTSMWLAWNLFLVYTIHRLNKKPTKSKRVREKRKKRARFAWINIFIVVLTVGFICVTGRGKETDYPTNTDCTQTRSVSLETSDYTTTITPALEAKNVLVYDVEKAQILYEKNSEENISPASTTKLLTALTVLKHCSTDEVVTVGTEIYNIASDASTAFLTEGDVLSVKDLLIAMLLPSGNDAAYVLAKYTGSKILNESNIYDYTDANAIGTFVEEMNFTADSLGATSSFFTTPDGYEAEGQYTTAKDLTIITNACLSNQTIMDIVSKSSIYCTWENGKEVTYHNTNELLNPESTYYYSGVFGMKTGYGDSAGACIISVVNINGSNYICTVMNSNDDARWTDTLAIYRELENTN